MYRVQPYIPGSITINIVSEMGELYGTENIKSSSC